MIEFGDIILRDAKQGCRQIATKLVDLLAIASFKMNVFKRYIKSFTNSKDVTARNTRQLMKDEGFPEVLVRGNNEKKYGNGTVRVRDVTTVI